MRNAETILGVIRERGRQGLPLENIYRLLYNRDLYLRAYAHLYPNKGAMTPGTTPETVDGMSLANIDKLIEDVRYERYRWTPVRRVHIPKENGKMRPFGLPTWSDKLLQEVMRSILEAYYEPQFSDHAHGFRPGRGCHTALNTIRTTWTGTRWFIEGDIAQCFDRIDHSCLLEILSEKIHDNRFLRLIQNLVQAGYLENWVYGETLSGTPQGGVISPILSNIYLDRLDKYVETVLLPAYNRGAKRAHNRRYSVLNQRMVVAKKRGQKELHRELRKQKLQVPAYDPHDPNHRRLRYIRYADDFLLGFSGPKDEAEEIKRKLGEFLSNTLKLQLSPEKTLITHATTEAARFLGYEIENRQVNDKLDHNRRRFVNGRISLRLPLDVLEKCCNRYKKDGKPSHRPEMLNDDDFTIVARYQAEYRGIVQYYLLAQNVDWLWNLHWVMQTSLLKTLADKNRTSVRTMSRKYRATIQLENGKTLKCLEVRVERGEGKPTLIARFGGITLVRNAWATLDDQPPHPMIVSGGNRTELITRLLADECELCGSRTQIQVHHIRKLADLKRKGQKERPQWVERMAARRRKTLVVCHECHTAIHAGMPTRQQPE